MKDNEREGGKERQESIADSEEDLVCRSVILDCLGLNIMPSCLLSQVQEQ